MQRVFQVYYVLHGVTYNKEINAITGTEAIRELLKSLSRRDKHFAKILPPKMN